MGIYKRRCLPRGHCNAVRLRPRSLSFIYGRPKNPGGGGGNAGNPVLVVELFFNGAQVGSIFTGSVPSSLSTFHSSSIDPNNTPFNEVLVYASNTFLIESLNGASAPTPTPAPPAALLLGAGLTGLQLDRNCVTCAGHQMSLSILRKGA